ncbi:tail fiber protein [Synechococcus phage S-H68]|nr:tail fiber protein [Synechococcus phage S-H68]
MITPSQFFNDTKEIIEVVEESIEEKQTLEEEISHSVSLIDGAFRSIQENILSSNKKELSVYKGQVLEVYNFCNDIKENLLPRYKKEVIQSDLRTDQKIKDLKQEFYETLEERIEETKETIKVYFREEVKDLNKLRASVVLVERYIKENSSAIVSLREEVFAQLRESNSDSEVNQIVIQDKLDEISKEYETLSEGLLNEPPSTSNSDPLTPLDQNFVTLDQLQQHYKVFVSRVQQQLATVGGGGEVRLEFLDDIDRSTALIDGRVLAYQASTGKFIGTTTTSGSGLPSGSVGQLLQHDGSSFVGIASTGFSDYVISEGQGYYAYTTDYYTVGVANTTQEIVEGEWTLVQPQVASNGLYNYQPGPMLRCNAGDPWVGSGATIGTGQTEFSLAGTKPGTSCIVRSVFRFEPDTDETDLDMRLHFTTNTATQGTGLTNFNIEKQALVMTVGAAVTYTSETLISFFVGETLYGDTKADAGSFCVEVNGTTDGTLEILGLTVMVDV